MFFHDAFSYSTTYRPAMADVSRSWRPKGGPGIRCDKGSERSWIHGETKGELHMIDLKPPAKPRKARKFEIVCTRRLLCLICDCYRSPPSQIQNCKRMCVFRGLCTREKHAPFQDHYAGTVRWSC